MLAVRDAQAAPLWGLSAGSGVVVCTTSLGGLAFATLEGWPVWARGLAVVIPWVPVFCGDLVWIYQRYRWLALFYGVVVAQGGHCIEHVSQMIQIHAMGLSGPAAAGIFSGLNTEWVHFVWNTWVILAVALLMTPYSKNPWLWITAVLAGWHEVEHAYIFSVYLQTGISGTPGLLSQGGALWGGLPLSRPDLHFLYNLVETVPLFVAFFGQVRRDARPRRSVPRPSRA
jgi:hypothetical protein